MYYTKEKRRKITEEIIKEEADRLYAYLPLRILQRIACIAGGLHRTLLVVWLDGSIITNLYAEHLLHVHILPKSFKFLRITYRIFILVGTENHIDRIAHAGLDFIHR